MLRFDAAGELGPFQCQLIELGLGLGLFFGKFAFEGVEVGLPACRQLAIVRPDKCLPHVIIRPCEPVLPGLVVR